MSTELELYGKIEVEIFLCTNCYISHTKYHEILDDFKWIVNSNISHDFVRDLDFDEDEDTLGYYDEGSPYKFYFTIEAHGYMEEQDLNVRKNLLALNTKKVKELIYEKYGTGNIIIDIKNKTFSEKDLY